MSRDFVNDIFSKGELGIMEYLDSVKARAAADRKKILLDIQAEAIVETMLGTDNLYLYRLNELARRVKEAISGNINKEQDEATPYYEKAMSMGVLERTGANSGQTTDAQSLNPGPQQMELKDLLPKKLKADEAVEVFQNAIDAQLITNSPEGLKWNDTKQLLAYFATKVSDKFNLTTKLDKDGNKTTDWKTFETLFEQKGLKGAKQNWMRLKNKFEPTGFEKVDALF